LEHIYLVPCKKGLSKNRNEELNNSIFKHLLALMYHLMFVLNLIIVNKATYIEYCHDFGVSDYGRGKDW
jgi:hypothetical protein